MQKNRNTTKASLALGITGSSGRMGRRVLALAFEDPGFSVAYAWTRPGSIHLGKDIGLLIDKEMTGTLLQKMDELSQADVLIDFSVPEAIETLLHKAVSFKKPLVIGTTGLEEKTKAALEQAARHIPVLYAANFSLGIPLCIDIVRTLAKRLQGAAYIDIIETHHIHKKDQPSGTALAFAAAADGYKSILAPTKQRSPNEIGIHSLRTGEVVGEHAVIFECGKERIEIKHQAHSRDAFAMGALKAAEFLVRQPPGLYSIKDLYSFS